MKKEKPKKIRLLLVDDHPIVLEGIKSHLALYDDLEIVGVANNGQDALQKAKQTSPDIILMDVTMPQMNGLEAIGLLRRRVPTAKVVFLSMHDNKEYITQAIRSGARGYLLKDTAPTELIRAIRLIQGGEVYFSPTVSRVVIEEILEGKPPADSTPRQLTEREREVLVLIAEGHLNKQIADRLGIGVRTIETHRERIMRKLEIHTVAGLTKFAIARGMVRLEA